MIYFSNIFYKYKTLLLLWTTLFFVLFRHSAQAGTTEYIAWQCLETKYTIIFYQSAEDLRKFCAKVKYGPKDQGLRSSSSRTRLEDLTKSPSKKTDAVFERVQNILGMRKKMDKVKINVYKNKAQLHKAYAALYKGACSIRAWYRHRDNTIYVNANDIHEGVLAHELTHAIVDHYLLVRPPRATAEIIARYVDNHLTKKVPPYDPPEAFLGLSH
jgi:hypothetical protein